MGVGAEKEQTETENERSRREREREDEFIQLGHCPHEWVQICVRKGKTAAVSSISVGLQGKNITQYDFLYS